MGDEVKITVIATGFERSNLPAIERSVLTCSNRDSVRSECSYPMSMSWPPSWREAERLSIGQKESG